MKTTLFYLGLLVSGMLQAQTDTLHHITTVGVEADVLPYLTKGYYASIWVGHNHFRYRAIITHVTTPDFVVRKGFTNNEIQAYTLIADYFFKPNFEKWWIGSGFEYWNAQIQSDARLSTAKYDNFIFTAGGGYVWKFYKNFYLNPWAAGHLRMAGDQSIIVDRKTYTIPFFIAEGSLKVGWHF